jgi:CDGSH-type Zn-finger protein
VLQAPAVFLANVQGPWLHPEQDTPEHLVHVARSCPSGAITWRRHDGGAEESAPQVNVIFVRENGPYAVQAALQIDGQATLYRATLCRCGQSKNKPFCDNSHRETGFQATGEPPSPFHSQASEPLRERGGTLRLTPLEDGPLSLHGPVEICSGTGRTVTRTTGARLCRCGASANKPFCDGSHRRVGFTS